MATPLACGVLNTDPVHRHRIQTLTQRLRAVSLKRRPVEEAEDPTGASGVCLSPRESELGKIWEQLRPNTGDSGGVGPTRKQDESTR